MDVLKLFCWVKNQVILWKVQTNKLYSNINLFSCEIKPSLYSWHCWNKSRKWLWTESTISMNLVQVQTTARNILGHVVDGTRNVDWLIDVVSFVTSTRLIVPRKCVCAFGWEELSCACWRKSLCQGSLLSVWQVFMMMATSSSMAVRTAPFLCISHTPAKAVRRGVFNSPWYNFCLLLVRISS